MIPSGLFTQIALVVLSVAVAFTYIKPTFSDISSSQEQISVYQTERDQVNSFNSTLESKLQKVSSVASDDVDRLLTYMPDRVDPLAVMRDLETFGIDSGVEIQDITDVGPVDDEVSDLNEFDPYAYASEDPFASPVEVSTGPYAYVFTLSAEGTYSQIKRLVDIIEKNNYPLEIHKLNLNATEGGFLAAELTLYTYSKDKMEQLDSRTYEDVNVTYE